MRALGIAIACGALGVSAVAAAAPALPATRGTPLLPRDVRWRWQTIEAPALANQVGALAVTGLDTALGARPSPIEVLGDPAATPARWPYDVAGDAPAIPAPAEGRRIAAAFGIATFAIDPVADASLEMLELRLRYHDGVAVWLNGLELARRSLPRGNAAALAVRPHGPEWETFYVPVAPGLLRPGLNTLAVEVHPSSRRDAPDLEVDLVGRRDRGIVRGPVLADVAARAATIVVETDPGVDAVIEWGKGDAADHTERSGPARIHRFTLAGLEPGVRYGYRVIAGASRTPRYPLHTLPEAGRVIRIAAYGDVRGGHDTHRRLIERMLSEGVDAVVATGDLVLRGTDDADWQRFFAVTGDLLAQLPYYSALGNHDYGWSRSVVAGVFPLPAGPANRPAGGSWYSRDLADVHLVFLDSDNYDLPEQAAWLDADLAAARARGVRAILALTHDGPYSRGEHGGNPVACARYVPILTRHKVDVILSGHDHIYQRGRIGGLTYVVTGGGGAPLYDLRCGSPGRRRCKHDDGTEAARREHHYLVITIGRKLELCARRPDGTLLEKCVRQPLAH